MHIDSTLFEHVENHIYTLLKRQEGGLSEHALLKQLAGEADEQESPYFQDSFDDNLKLFQAHFLLFHLLYRLKQKLFGAKTYHLEISPLNIQLHAWETINSSSKGYQATTSERTLTSADPLTAYYLDLSHLEKTDAKDVERLLMRFYAGLSGPDTRQSALETLGLTDPVDDQTIKKRYRSLAMAHHPDRGGDTETLQAINQAMAQLMP